MKENKNRESAEENLKKVERAKKWALDERVTKKLDHIINRIGDEPVQEKTEEKGDVKITSNLVL